MASSGVKGSDCYIDLKLDLDYLGLHGHKWFHHVGREKKEQVENGCCGMTYAKYVQLQEQTAASDSSMKIHVEQVFKDVSLGS